MVYYFFEYTLGRAFTVFFRKIYFEGTEKIPANKRILYAVNHPTAFIEPILIGCFVPKNVHVLLRGDVFKPGVANWFLRQIKTIPIFRPQDGIELMKKNVDSIQEVTEILHGGKEAVLILSEGVSKHEKKLRPIQKGTARMAFGVYEEHGHEDIAIIPIGVNYADATQFRTIVSFEIGEPLLIEDYLSLYKEHNKKAINQLTKDIGTSLRQNVVHIENSDDESLANLILDFNRNNFKIKAFPYKEKDRTLLRQEINIAENINTKPAAEKEELKKKVDSYLRKLHEYRVSDLGAAQSKSSNFWNWLLLIIGFPIHVLGLIWNYPPIRYAKHIADTKSAEMKFFSSIAFGVGFFAWGAWWISWTVLTLLICNWVAALAVLVLMPLLGRLSLLYGELRNEVSNARCFSFLSKEKQHVLLKMREQILKEVK